jgi:4-amino-4-deoxy-L-arabinose transferase-like glycosyltransferase
MKDESDTLRFGFILHPSSFILGLLAFLAVYLLFFHRLGARDLWSSHEARAAMDATTLLDGQGPLLVPYLFDGSPELQKPPLYYALVALAGWAQGGIDAQAVRLPATLAGVGTCALLALWLARRGRPLLGLLAATILATAIHFTLLARTGRIDLPLTFTTFAATLAFATALGPGPRSRWYLLAGHVTLAAGILLKGPIALLLLVAALLPWLLWERPAPWSVVLRRLELWWGLPLLALLVLPWLLWINANTDGEFFRVFLWEHNLERGLGTGRLRTYPGWYYLPLLAINFLPWSPLLFGAVLLALWRRWTATDAELRRALAALGGMLGLLSLAAFKRADYLAPLYPWAALIVAVALERAVLTLAGNPRLIPLLCVILLVLAGTGQAIYTHTDLARVEPQRECATFATTIKSHADPGEPIVQFRTECHALAYHLGRGDRSALSCRLVCTGKRGATGHAILLQWPDLAARVRESGSVLAATVPEAVEDLPATLTVERLADNTPARGGHHDRPLILLRVRLRIDSPPWWKEEVVPCPSFPSSPPSPPSP